MRRGLPAPALAVVLFLTSCASLPVSGPPASVGPYSSLHARLLVIEPARRWQVMLDWQADSATTGSARLTHAASGTVVELRWQRDTIRLRDNNAPDWRRVSSSQLAEHGIVISPYSLSRFLAGHVPAEFRQTGANAWESSKAGNIIRIRWNPDSRRLELSDIRRGRMATLIILDGQPPQTAAPKQPHA